MVISGGVVIGRTRSLTAGKLVNVWEVEVSTCSHMTCCETPAGQGGIYSKNSVGMLR